MRLRRKQSDIEPMEKHKRLQGRHSTIISEAKQSPYIIKALLIGFNSRTLKTYLKFLLRSYPNSIPFSDDSGMIWEFKFLNSTLS